mmetsp:Transcript_16500/g.51660  ORF Transcript_16500/g.51660 Transcript_16500/m.51660 type:complete len:98 (+) Transcript_16500:46-339(+)
MLLRQTLRGGARRVVALQERRLGAEAAMQARLSSELEATAVRVEDVSGGCGAMYRIYVESPKFKGVPTVKQHRMVNEILKEEIKEMHGLTLDTKASP